MGHWFYDDPVAWEFFDEIEDFKCEMKEFGCVELKPDSADSKQDEAYWDAHIFAAAVAEERIGWPRHGQQERSRGPGRRVRHRYWDKERSKV